MKDELLDHDWKQRGDFSGHAFHGRALHLLKKDIMIMIENRANDPEAWTSLSRLLDISATCNVTDIRDKAYGMLAMMDPAVAIHISPDYTMSAKEVFTNVAITAFKVYENLELLSECTLCPPQQGPTWVPDWSWHRRERDARPWSPFKANESKICSFSIDRNRLRLACEAIL